MELAHSRCSVSISYYDEKETFGVFFWFACFEGVTDHIWVFGAVSP